MPALRPAPEFLRDVFVGNRADFLEDGRGFPNPLHFFSRQSRGVRGRRQNRERQSAGYCTHFNTIVKWANGGALEGNPADLPPQPTFASEWLMGQPDAVFTMQEDYPIPAESTIAYQYFELPTTFTEDKWIQAMEVRAGDPRVLHHVIIYARAPPPDTFSMSRSGYRRRSASRVS